MQQQSQIFVFSTSLANKASESVLSGQYKSLIEFHIDQPNTKKYLQVCVVLYLFYFSGGWLYLLKQVKQKQVLKSFVVVIPKEGLVGIRI